MTRNLKQPFNKVHYTDIIYVKWKSKKGKRFEIACYPDKVKEWRNGIEKNLDVVIQIEKVFTNASRGIEASKTELKKAFDTDKHEIACEHILNNGIIQISKRERREELEKTFKEIATIISMKCINTKTLRPFPRNIIRNAMRTIHFSIKPNAKAKVLALKLIPQLKLELPISRAQMRLKLTFLNPDNKREIRKNIEKLVFKITKEQFFGYFVFEVLIDPGYFRELNELVKKISLGKGQIEVIDSNVKIEDEIFL